MASRITCFISIAIAFAAVARSSDQGSRANNVEDERAWISVHRDVIDLLSVKYDILPSDGESVAWSFHESGKERSVDWLLGMVATEKGEEPSKNSAPSLDQELNSFVEKYKVPKKTIAAFLFDFKLFEEQEKHAEK